MSADPAVTLYVKMPISLYNELQDEVAAIGTTMTAYARDAIKQKMRARRTIHGSAREILAEVGKR